MASLFDLDHIGVAVRDLDAAAAIYRRLGFRLTEKSEHVTPGPDGTLVPAGTGNHCFILAQGYVELIAVTRPGYAGSLLRTLSRHEGLHLVSVGAPSALEAQRLFERTTGGPVTARRLKRPFRESGRDFVAEFALVYLPDDTVPGVNLFAIEHLTRGAIWQPHLCEHPNGAAALKSVTVCASAASEYRDRLSRLLDTTTSGGSIPLRHGAIEVATPADLARRFPGIGLPAPPAAVAMSLAVRDLAQTAVTLDRNGVAYAREPQRLWVSSVAACGAIVEFVSEARS